MKSFYKKDLKTGMDGEDNFKKLLEDEYKIELIKSEDKMSFWDYKIKNKNVLIELKTRNNYRDKYPDTLVGYNKLIYFNKFNKTKEYKYQFVLAFQFQDGCYFTIYEPTRDIGYNKKNNSKYRKTIDMPYNKNFYNVDDYKRNFRFGCRDKLKPYLRIPINELMPIKDLITELENHNTFNN